MDNWYIHKTASHGLPLKSFFLYITDTLQLLMSLQGLLTRDPAVPVPLNIAGSSMRDPAGTGKDMFFFIAAQS